MAKPYLLVVTGRPGAGKTTFSKALSEEIHMPVISRDQIKEGYVHTFGKKHAQLPPETNGVVTGIFFDTLQLLVTNHVSVIAEAAFQHRMWSSYLEPFQELARIRMLICRAEDGVAYERYIRRGLEDPLREYFHGDAEVDMARMGKKADISPYNEPHIDVPTFHIDTTGAYQPSIAELTGMIFGK